MKRLLPIIIVIALAFVAGQAIRDVGHGAAREQGRGEVLDSED